MGLKTVNGDTEMTSDEIAELIEVTSASAIDTVVKTKIISTFEIAFQLAKLNEHFEKVDGAVFGGVDAKKKEKA
jgi:hypothetical protein